MAGPNKIDRDALHRYLYRRSDRFHRYKMDAVALAEELGLSYYNFTVIIRGMAAEGRLRRIAGQKMGPKTYLVEDPANWG